MRGLLGASAALPVFSWVLILPRFLLDASWSFSHDFGLLRSHSPPRWKARQTSFSFALDCTTLLVLQFATLFELAAPPATPSILVSTNFNTPRGLGADAHPSNVADVKGISSALPRAPFSTPRHR
ncbi:hypothetical protein FB107DRAFT_274824 [Schizophyllum commune]